MSDSLHDGMPYGPIQGQGQGQGHGASEVPKIALFQVYLLRHLQRTLNFEGSLRIIRPQKKVFSDFSDIWYVRRK